MTATAIQLRGLRKNFGTLTAVDSIDLTIRRGEVVALLGPNGAGKSTTIDLALGLSRPTAGSATLFDRDPRAAIVEGKVGVMLQGGALLPSTTVGQSVALIASAHRHPLTVEQALARAGIAELAKQRISRLSGGQLQRARYAVAIVSDPELLILDEPTAAMDVETRREFWRSMREFTAEGRTVVFATHYLDEADDFADRIVILKSGRIVADGTPSEVKSVVSGRVIRFRLDDAAKDDAAKADAVSRALAEHPELHRATRQGDRFTVPTDDPDSTLRLLLAEVPDARDIEIESHNMDDAFIALTSPIALTAPSELTASGKTSGNGE